MKVIFLDCDGVLNCRSDFKGSSLCLCKKKIGRIKRLVKATKAKIVLSSTWRRHERHRKYLIRNGIKFIDVTPVSNTSEKWKGNYVRRGTEINEWLKLHPEVTRYVILDDDGDMLEHQFPFFVNTDFETGVTSEHIKLAVDILNK